LLRTKFFHVLLQLANNDAGGFEKASSNIRALTHAQLFAEAARRCSRATSELWADSDLPFTEEAHHPGRSEYRGTARTLLLWTGFQITTAAENEEEGGENRKRKVSNSFRRCLSRTYSRGKKSRLEEYFGLCIQIWLLIPGDSLSTVLTCVIELNIVEGMAFRAPFRITPHALPGVSASFRATLCRDVRVTDL
jgi:hypothetical protein